MPEESKIKVFKRGTWVALKGTIPVGGQKNPISRVGDSLLWKKAQKKEKKNSTSEVINRIMPQRKPLITWRVCRPWNVLSRVTSRHHWKVVSVMINIPRNIRLVIVIINHLTMLVKSNHTYHLVDQSPWPISASLSAFILVTGIVKWFIINTANLILIGIFITILTTFQWWRDITRERTFQGLHTLHVIKGLRWGIILFITSEVLFFFSFFLSLLSQQTITNLRGWIFMTPNGDYPF